jgi:DNA-binding beta-propeller fold protein YncE
VTQPTPKVRLSRWHRLSVTLAVLATAIGVGYGAVADTWTGRDGDDRANVRSTTPAASVRTPAAPPTAVGDTRHDLVPDRALGPNAPLAGMPPVLGDNIYAAAGANMLSPVVRADPYRIYVPESGGSAVDVIDPNTMQIVSRFQTGRNPQHVVPSYDLRTLYVTNDLGNSLTPIDPRTTRPRRSIPVDDPYNMYYTPDGRYAIVVAEAHRHLDFRDPRTFALRHRVPVDCAGVDHMDFAANGGYLIATCEFSGQLVKVNLHTFSVVRYLRLRGSSPQDIKLDPTGTLFYVADRYRGGVWLVSAATFRPIGFIKTGRDAHGLYPSRNAKFLYVTNRRSGSVSVISFATRRIVKTWRLPGGGSPDMGNTSPDGKVLWLAGRYSSRVYAISTVDGHLIGSVAVGPSPHGLCVWPQPGRYSLGHTGVTR